MFRGESLCISTVAAAQLRPLHSTVNSSLSRKKSGKFLSSYLFWVKLTIDDSSNFRQYLRSRPRYKLSVDMSPDSRIILWQTPLERSLLGKPLFDQPGNRMPQLKGGVVAAPGRGALSKPLRAM